jgi:predicted CoA-binding protein
MKTTRKQIDDFLALKRLAVVGVSRDPKHFSNTLWQEFRQRRYDAVPVNPSATDIDGKRCYARVQDIQPGVDAVLVITPATATEQVLHDCVEAGVRHVWLYKGMEPGRKGSATASAVQYLESNGVDVVNGFCPYMFLPGTSFFHGLHGLGKKLTGSYPS